MRFDESYTSRPQRGRGKPESGKICVKSDYFRELYKITLVLAAGIENRGKANFRWDFQMKFLTFSHKMSISIGFSLSSHIRSIGFLNSFWIRKDFMYSIKYRKVLIKFRILIIKIHENIEEKMEASIDFSSRILKNFGCLGRIRHTNATAMQMLKVNYIFVLFTPKTLIKFERIWKNGKISINI